MHVFMLDCIECLVIFPCIKIIRYCTKRIEVNTSHILLAELTGYASYIYSVMDYDHNKIIEEGRTLLLKFSSSNQI